MFSAKKAIALTGAAVMMFSMAACGSNGGDSSSQEISFQTWNLKNDTYTPYFENLIEQFESDNPGVTVK